MNNLKSRFKIHEGVKMLSKAEMKKVLGGDSPCSQAVCPSGYKVNVRDLGNHVYECTCVITPP